MEELHIIIRVGSEWVAMPAHVVESVNRIGTVVPVPGAPAVVRGVVAVRSRILTLIDAARLVGEPSAADQSDESMVIIEVAGHAYGIAVAQVDDVVLLTDIRPAPAHLAPGWARLSPRVADYRGQSLLLIDPGAFVAAIVVEPAMT